MVIGTMINLNLRACLKSKSQMTGIKSIWSSQYPLKPFVDPNFKTYDELKEKLNRTITGARSTETVDEVTSHHNHLQTSMKMPEVNEI